MRITLLLHDDEHNALLAVSKADRRHPRQQAAMLIRESLERRGLIPGKQQTAVVTETAESQGASHEPK